MKKIIFDDVFYYFKNYILTNPETGGGGGGIGKSILTPAIRCGIYVCIFSLIIVRTGAFSPLYGSSLISNVLFTFTVY
jgi:hypothetical protein